MQQAGQLSMQAAPMKAAEFAISAGGMPDLGGGKSASTQTFDKTIDPATINDAGTNLFA